MAHGSDNASKAAPDERFPRSIRVWWAWLDLNQRPHPYQQSGVKRHADQRFPRSLANVRGEGMRSNSPPRSAHRCNAVAAGKVCHQPVVGKVMGLPGGRGSPIERRDRDYDYGQGVADPGSTACPSGG